MEKFPALDSIFPIFQHLQPTAEFFFQPGVMPVSFLLFKYFHWWNSAELVKAMLPVSASPSEHLLEFMWCSAAVS